MSRSALVPLLFRAAVTAAAFLVALLARHGAASAAPMVTPLETLRKEATAIVLGTVSPGLEIEVDTVIHGNAKLGRRRVKPSPDGHTTVSGRALVVLDKDDRLRWAGSLVAGGSLETGVIQLYGFFDWNAHLVSPGVLTLAQLRTFLASGTFTQRFEVSVVAHDGTGAFAATGARFVVDHDPFARSSKATGIPSPCPPPAVLAFDVGSGAFHVVGTCPKDRRTLALRTKVTGASSNGAITVDAQPAEPYLDAKDFAVFWKDPTVVTVKRLLEVKLDDGATWTWDVGHALVDPKNARREPGAMSVSSSLRGGRDVVTVVHEFRGVRITFDDVVRGTSVSSGGDGPSLVHMADVRGYGTCTFEADGRPPRTCTLGRGRSRFTRR